MTFKLLCLLMGYNLAYGFGFTFNGVIIKDIKSRPFGSQSILDIPLRLVLDVKQLICLLSIVLVHIQLLMDNVEDILAKVFMWPMKFGTTIKMVMTAIVPSVQMMIVANPNLDLTVDDDLAFWILAAVVMSPFIITAAICHPLGYYT